MRKPTPGKQRLMQIFHCEHGGNPDDGLSPKTVTVFGESIGLLISVFPAFLIKSDS